MQTNGERHRRRQSYADWSLNELRKEFNLDIVRTALFADIGPVEPSPWLREVLDKGFALSVVSEKARSEFIVAPILLFLSGLHSGQVGVYSGVKFDVEPARGLRGVCDFIISRSPTLPIVQAPVLMLVEAKKNDIEEGLGQCVSEMIAAQLFNQREGTPVTPVFGCVTSGESWQFLSLHGAHLEMDDNRYFLSDLPLILGVLSQIVTPP